MKNTEEYDRLLNEASNHPDQVTNIQRLETGAQYSALQSQSNNRRVFHFLSELRRRHVCRAATMYAIAFWLICQIVGTIAPELALPAWTLKFVIVLGLAGFPIALTISWFVDITSEGVVVDHEGGSVESASAQVQPRRPVDHVLDCSLLIAALVIGMQLATGFLSTPGNATEINSPKIALLPMRVASGNEAGVFAEGLLAQIQHELVSKSRVTVIPARESDTTPDCFSLTGVVAIDERLVKVTATITDNRIGVVTWSEVFTRTLDGSLDTQVDLARDIVAALPVPFKVSSVSNSKLENRHAT